MMGQPASTPRPNLFNFATSELSQDAFICWLLSWAKPEFAATDVALNRCAQQTLRAMFANNGKPLPINFVTVNVQRQVNNVDVLVVVNDCHYLIIEDKIATRDHSRQLEKYYEQVLEEAGSPTMVAAIYFKMEEQGNYRSVTGSLFSHFSRRELLPLLQQAVNDGCNSDILLDYLSRIEWLDGKINQYLTQLISSDEDWGRLAWQGFFTDLQSRLGDGDWGSVPRKSGAFMGFWWATQSDDHCRQYLQLTAGALCFKISTDNKAEVSSLRRKWHSKVTKSAADQNFACRRPSRFGHGRTVTVMEGDSSGYRKYSADGRIDLHATVEYLTLATKVPEAAMLLDQT